VGVAPHGYRSWSDGIKAYVTARANDETPDTVDPCAWNVFEMMAFQLIPKVSR
jgi:hypothetical protein